MQPKPIEYRRRRDFGESVSVTFEFLRQHFRPLGRAVLFICGPVILIVSVVGGIFYAGLVEMMSFSTEGRIRDPEAYLADFLGNMGVTFLLSMVAITFIAGVVNEYIRIAADAGERDEPIAVDEVWELMKEDLWMHLTSIFGTIVIVVIGTLFLVIPGVYLAIALSIIASARTMEQIGFFKGISRSISLTSGHWWFTAGLLFVMSIISSFLGMGFAVPQYVVMFLIGLNAAEGGNVADYQLAMVVTNAISFFGSYLVYSLSIITLALHYFSLVERKEGTGAMVKITQIGAGDPGQPVRTTL
jgi:hypothetical protein